eukprot:GEZU01004503.1.p1 GENE.GEZU01004503.1~~GEZU01004503.1.p1  ORF type:complete len:549 (-),score=108.53 GEZU01004503.1:17-1663(-)
MEPSKIRNRYPRHKKQSVVSDYGSDTNEIKESGGGMGKSPTNDNKNKAGDMAASPNESNNVLGVASLPELGKAYQRLLHLKHVETPPIKYSSVLKNLSPDPDRKFIHTTAQESDDFGVWVYNFDIMTHKYYQHRLDYNVLKQAERKARKESPFNRKNLFSSEHRLRLIRSGKGFVEEDLIVDETEQNADFFPIPSFDVHFKKQSTKTNLKSGLAMHSRWSSSKKFRQSTTNLIRSQSTEPMPRTPMHEDGDMIPVRPHSSTSTNYTSDDTDSVNSSTITLPSIVDPRRQQQSKLLLLQQQQQQRQSQKNAMMFNGGEDNVIEVDIHSWRDVFSITKMKKQKEWQQIMEERKNDRQEIIRRKKQLGKLADVAMRDARCWSHFRMRNEHQVHDLWGKPHQELAQQREHLAQRRLFWDTLVAFLEENPRARSAFVLETLPYIKQKMMERVLPTKNLFFQLVDHFGLNAIEQDQGAMAFFQLMRSIVGVSDDEMHEYRNRYIHNERQKRLHQYKKLIESSRVSEASSRILSLSDPTAAANHHTTPSMDTTTS